MKKIILKLDRFFFSKAIIITLFSTLYVTCVNADTPHSNYVSQQQLPSLPASNCQWYQVRCKTKFGIKQLEYMAQKNEVNRINYQNRYNTQYPIVLVHGVSGFDQILGLVEYFQGIPAELRKGGAVVYTPNLTAWEDVYVRGEQLMSFIENTVLPETGASKVNFIGHSLGAPTARYISGIKPEIVASITSVNGGNYGSGVADWAIDNLFGTVLEKPAVKLISLSGNLLDALSGNPEYSSDALKTLKFGSSKGSAIFNQQFPDGQPSEYCGEGERYVNGVHYFSWGSTGIFTNFLDVSDPILALTDKLGYWNGDESDGLVAKCAQHWGEVISVDYSMNHLDATNMLFGLHNLLETNPITLFENHASRLRGLFL
jgi:triacylglycerol lipase